MKISDLIKQLEEAKDKHGDLEVRAEHADEGVWFKIQSVQYYEDFYPDCVFISQE